MEVIKLRGRNGFLRLQRPDRVTKLLHLQGNHLGAIRSPPLIGGLVLCYSITPTPELGFGFCAASCRVVGDGEQRLLVGFLDLGRGRVSADEVFQRRPLVDDFFGKSHGLGGRFRVAKSIQQIDQAYHQRGQRRRRPPSCPRESPGAILAWRGQRFPVRKGRAPRRHRQ